MPSKPIRRLARLEKRELSEIPSHWSKEERGRFLWRLFRERGIDPSRLYTVEYFPHRQCWLLTQELAHGPDPRPIALAPPCKEGLLFHTQVSIELRRTALAALTADGRSVRFGRFGCTYPLPPRPQETTTADLLRSLGGSAEEATRVRFTSEGGWRIAPLDE